MAKPRILFHSECLFFSGSERMLINFFKDEKFRSEFEVSFITSKSEKYLKELLTFLYLTLIIGKLVFLNNFFHHQISSIFHEQFRYCVEK